MTNLWESWREIQKAIEQESSWTKGSGVRLGRFRKMTGYILEFNIL